MSLLKLEPGRCVIFVYEAEVKMKKTILGAIAAAIVLLAAPRVIDAQEISFGMFYNSLAPYGQWVNAGSYGMCWRPYGMQAEWTPYTQGHWVWSDYGWTWVSSYHWGWAPFHYGRWILDARYGWIWMPGYVWAPAWVQWRWGDGYCGWAPLPPGFHFRLDVVVGPDRDDFGVGLRGWNFIGAREMGLYHYRFIDRDAVPRVMGRTRNVTRFRFTSRGVFDIGLTREEVQRVTRRRIGTVRVTRTNDIGKQRIIGDRIHIYSPAPFEPRIRNEREIIRRERVYRVPERVRTDRPGASREISPPRVEQQRAVPRVERQREAPRVERQRLSPRVEPQRRSPQIERRRQDSVRPGQKAPQKVKEGARERAKSDKEKGPGHRR